MIVDYHIVSETNTSALMKSVWNMLNSGQGWEPQGGPFTTETEFGACRVCQAMVKVEQAKDRS